MVYVQVPRCNEDEAESVRAPEVSSTFLFLPATLLLLTLFGSDFFMPPRSLIHFLALI
jgi:hypothetical protein